MRTVGIYAYRPNYRFDWLEGFLVLQVESDIIMLFCCFLNTLSLMEAHDVSRFFKSFGDVLNQVASISVMSSLLVLPFFVIDQVNQNFKRLSLGNSQGLIGVLVKDLKVDSIYRAAFTFVFLVRRLFLVFVIVFLTKYNSIQCILMVASSLLKLVYLMWTQPFKKSSHLALAVFNEGQVWINAVVLYGFCDASIDLGLRDNIGWVYIGNITINIVVNLVVATYMNGKEAIKERKKHIEKKQDEKFFDEFMQNRRQISILDERFEQF